MAEPLWTCDELLAATGGRLGGARFDATGVSFDSRELKPGDLFVALRGERDGHAFARMAFERGAAGALVSELVDGPYIEVPDTLAALERLGASIHGMRFDAGDGYLTVRRDAVILLHGATPALEGKPSATKDAGGRLLTDLIRDALQNADEATVSYLFPKPGQAEAQPKISYVTRFAP